MTDVVLYVRPECPLCDAARDVLDAAGVGFDEVDVSRERELESAYGRYVPVVEVDSKEVFSGGMDPQALPDLVRRT